MKVQLTIEAYGKCSPASTRFDFDQGRVTIGRAPSSNWVLDDPDHIISKTHCELKINDAAVQVTDLSSNGLYINGSFSPLGRGKTELLKNGDRIQIGEYVIRLDIEAPPEEDFLGSPFDQAGPEDLTEVLAPSAERSPGGSGEPSFGERYGSPFEEAAPVGGRDPLGLDETPGEAVPEEPAFPDHLPLDEHFMPTPSFEPEEREPGPKPASKPAEPDSGSAGMLPDDWDLGDLLGPQASHETAEGQGPSGEGQPAVFDDILPTEPESPAEPIPEPTPESIPELTLEPTPESIPEPIPELIPKPIPAAPVADEPVSAGAQSVARGTQASARPGDEQGAAIAATAVAAERGGGGLFDVFLESAGIGLDGTGLDARRVAERSGLLFRKMLEGLMLLLQARTVVKNEYQLERTLLRPLANNPIKSLPSVDEILAILYRVQDSSGVWLEPAAAVDEAVQDLKSHELALLAGMNAAIEFFVAALAPERFGESGDRGMKKLLSISALDKVRGWDKYQTEYAELRKMLEEGLTGEARGVFERAYSREKQRLEG